MSLLAKTAGIRRVIIDHIRPCIDGGRNPFKRVIGDWIPFTVHAFADSHDLVRVRLRIRKTGVEDWLILPMHALGNDEFQTIYRTHEIGLFEYEVLAVVDHYGSWYEGFQKKHQEGVLSDIECQIGAGLLKEAAGRAEGRHARQLHEWAAHLGNSEAEMRTRISLVYSRHVADIAGLYSRCDCETISPRSFFLVERNLAAFSTWYEYFPRSCKYDGKTHGTFRDAAKRLPEIRDMGFNIVYLPPIHPIGHAFRKGKNNTLIAQSDDVGSPWAVGSQAGGHRSILSDLGTLDEFRSFLNEAEMHGLEVALDIAFQCSPDHPWVREHPAWFRRRPDGTVQYAENPPKKYQDILPINFESGDWENLWEELKSVFEFWIEQGVKVFRVDNPHTKSMEFWRWCILNIKAKHPEVLFLAEAFTRPKRKYFLAKSGFTQGYTYFTWRNTAEELRNYVEDLVQSDTKEYFWPNFWPNTPDILHADLQMGTRVTFIGRYVLAATLSSNVGIYGPAYELIDNEPFPGKEENNNSEKYELKAWNLNKPGNIRSEIGRINAIRNANSCFHRTFNVSFIPCSNNHIIAYLKENFDKTNRFIIVVNMDWDHKQVATLDLSPESLNLGTTYGTDLKLVDRLSPVPRNYVWAGGTAYIELDPKISPAHILQIIH